MKDIIIIGAGPAGLTAAYELMKQSGQYNVTIIEKDRYIGGIAKTVDYNGNKMDLGGHRYFSENKEIVDWWLNIIPLDNYKTRKKTVDDDIMLVQKRVSHILFRGKFIDYPISLTLNTIRSVGLIKSIQVIISYLYSVLFKREENTLEDFYINCFGKTLYKLFFEKYSEKVWGVHPRYISPKWGKQRVSGISIKSVIKNALFNNSVKEKSFINTFLYPKYGVGQLWEKVCDQIEKDGCKVITNHTITKIIHDKNSNKYICYFNDCGEMFLTGDVIISSMPIADLINICQSAPDYLKKIANNLPYRNFITVGILLNQTEQHFFNKDDCWIYIQDEAAKAGRVQIFNNWSPYMVNNKNHLWIGIEYFCGDDCLWKMDDESIANMAINEMEKIGIIKKQAVIDTHVERVSKAYPAYYGNYSKIENIISFLNKCDNLYCIGRNGQHRYNNMDHSMMTAIKAVELINKNSNDKAELWSVE